MENINDSVNTDSTESVNDPKDNSKKEDKVSLTKELKEDIKVITHLMKQKNAKVAGIFSLIASGIWLFCIIIGTFAHTTKPLTIVSIVFLVCALILFWIAWRKEVSSPENFRHKGLDKKFLLTAILCAAASIILGVFYIVGAYCNWTETYWKVIVSLDWVLGVAGLGLGISAGVLLFTATKSPAVTQ